MPPGGRNKENHRCQSLYIHVALHEYKGFFHKNKLYQDTILNIYVDTIKDYFVIDNL